MPTRASFACCRAAACQYMCVCDETVVHLLQKEKKKPKRHVLPGVWRVRTRVCVCVCPFAIKIHSHNSCCVVVFFFLHNSLLPLSTTCYLSLSNIRRNYLMSCRRSAPTYSQFSLMTDLNTKKKHSLPRQRAQRMYRATLGPLA